MNLPVITQSNTSSEPLKGEVIATDEYQETLASKLCESVFDGEDNAAATTDLISSFVQSYERHKDQQPLEEWLCGEFKNYPELWQNHDELKATAQEIITAVEQAGRSKASLQQHLDQGKSQANWLAAEIEKGAATAGSLSVGTYAGGIDQALQQASENARKIITNNAGDISFSPNLDGFIAEQHHVDTFNIDAVTKGSSYRAQTLSSYEKNSVDIQIVDADGKVVRQYQSKYGSDAKATEQLFNRGDYADQEKLVPAGQGEQIPDSTEVIEIDGVSSKPLSKAEALEQQRIAREKAEARQYEWNDTNRIEIAKQLGKQALLGACITAGLQGSRILARRVWNKLNGKANPSASEDLKEFFESSLRSTAHIGLQVAVSGALVVAAKNGWVGTLLKNTPAGRIANIACVGLENAKVLYKLAKGELTSPEALDCMAQTTTTTALAIAAATKGMALGAAYGSVFGPVGTAIGGFVGGVASGIVAGSIGEQVYSAGKSLVKTAITTTTRVISSVASGFASLGRAFSSLFS